MSDEEKITESEEIVDSFAEYFSEEAEPSGRDRAKGPDILAVAESAGDGMVIQEVVSVNEDDESAAEAVSEPQPEPAHEEMTSESGEPEKAEKAEKKSLFPNAQKKIEKRSHRYVAFIGTVVMILAVIGAVTAVRGIVRITDRAIHNTSVTEELEWKIYPLLMLDPATFDDPGQLDGDFLLKTCLWQTLLENRTTYEYDENMMLLVPASDLDVAAKKLYGDSVTLRHQTFSDGYEYFYVYDEENDRYQVPVSDQNAGYTPKIVQIKKSGDNYTVIAGYVPPTSLWNMSSDGATAEEVPTKYLYYDLLKTGYKQYIILSVRDIPADELPDNLEVASQQALNQTQYIDYSALYEEYMQGEGMEEGSNIPGEETGTDVAKETPTDASSESSEG